MDFDFFIRYYNDSKIINENDCYLLCGFPGSGNVGKLAIEYIINELKAIHILDIYSSLFPPQIIVNEKGLCELVKNSIYVVKTKKITDNNCVNLILITGDVQPNINNFEYILSKKIIDILKEFTIKKIISLAANVTGNIVEEPKIFGTCTNIDDINLLRQHDIEIIENGFVNGMNGIIIGLASLEGLKGICLLGETSGYIIDASAAHKILEKVNKLLNIDIHLENMQSMVKDTIILMENIQNQILTNKSENEIESNKEKEHKLRYIS